jgi:methionyl-tRNA formyltransferase
MRVAFAGTPEFAAVALQQLVAAGHTVVMALTQPDRPSGRGMKLHPSPVKTTALAHGVPVLQPRSLRLEGKFPEDAAQAQQALFNAKPDVMVVVAYGLLLPKWVLSLPAQGCLNIHASLLPRWRGAAPIHRAIEAGDAQTGITLMQMDEGLDTGHMLCTQIIGISPEDTTGSLHDKLAPMGGQMVVDLLAQVGAWQPVAQPLEGVCYAHKIDKAQAVVDWRDAADVIERRVRAFNPAPGASAELQGEGIKIWQAQCDTISGPPGTVLAVSQRGILVACGRGSLWLTELQRAGAKRLKAVQFLAGNSVMVGQKFKS